MGRDSPRWRKAQRARSSFRLGEVKVTALPLPPSQGLAAFFTSVGSYHTAGEERLWSRGERVREGQMTQKRNKIPNKYKY